MDDSSPTTKNPARTIIVVLSALALIGLAVALIVRGACAGANGTPQDRLLSQPPVATDLPPGGIAFEAELDEGSSRLVGTDSSALSYFVGTQGDETCLVIVKSINDWGSSCGRPGSFSVEFSGVVAWLGSDTFMHHVATESVQEVVFISPAQLA